MIYKTTNVIDKDIKQDIIDILLYLRGSTYHARSTNLMLRLFLADSESHRVRGCSIVNSLAFNGGFRWALIKRNNRKYPAKLDGLSGLVWKLIKKVDNMYYLKTPKVDMDQFSEKQIKIMDAAIKASPRWDRIKFPEGHPYTYALERIKYLEFKKTYIEMYDMRFVDKIGCKTLTNLESIPF